MTIEVIARDSRGNLAVTDFTIDLSAARFCLAFGPGPIS
jgi:hypothetical protein